MKSASQINWLPLVILAMGLVFTSLGWYSKLNRQELRRHGTEYAGTVEGGKVSEGSGKNSSDSYFLEVSWDDAGTPRRHWFRVKPDFYRDLSAKQGQTQTVHVLALPGQAEKAMIVGGTSDNTGMEWLGYVLLATGAFFQTSSWRRARATAAV